MRLDASNWANISAYAKNMHRASCIALVLFRVLKDAMLSPAISAFHACYWQVCLAVCLSAIAAALRAAGVGDMTLSHVAW